MDQGNIVRRSKILFRLTRNTLHTAVVEWMHQGKTLFRVASKYTAVVEWMCIKVIS